jgi:hypothetical protein
MSVAHAKWFHLAVAEYSVDMYERGQRGRRIARELIALAISCGFAALFMWLAQPGYIGPMFANYEPPWYVTALPLLGVASCLSGLMWMIRIYRAHPEHGGRSWRYRDR